MRVDSANGRVVHRVSTPLSATTVVFAGGSCGSRSAENGRIVKIDPETTSRGGHAAARDGHRSRGRRRSGVGLGRAGQRRLPPQRGRRQGARDAACGRCSRRVVASAGVWIADAKGGRSCTWTRAGHASGSRSRGRRWWRACTAVCSGHLPGRPPPGRPRRRPVRSCGSRCSTRRQPGLSHARLRRPGRERWNRQLAYSTCSLYLLDYPTRPELRAARSCPRSRRRWSRARRRPTRSGFVAASASRRRRARR